MFAVNSRPPLLPTLLATAISIQVSLQFPASVMHVEGRGVASPLRPASCIETIAGIPFVKVGLENSSTLGGDGGSCLKLHHLTILTTEGSLWIRKRCAHL